MIEENCIAVINDYSEFKRIYDLEQLKGKDNKLIALILNQKFEIFIPHLNKYYSIFDDKEMISLTGILGSLRPYHEYQGPYIPKVNFFEMFLKGIFISIYINLAVYNKLEHNTNLEIINKPFLNLVYMFLNFMKFLVKDYAEDLDKGENQFFPRDHYNYVKTKDGKYISIGNLESKFQDSFIKGVEKLAKEDEKNGFSSNYVWISDNDNDKILDYNLDNVTKVFSNHTRDELFIKVIILFLFSFIILKPASLQY